MGALGRQGGRGHSGAAATEEGAAPEPRRRLAAWSQAAESCRPRRASDLPRTPTFETQAGSLSPVSLGASSASGHIWVLGIRFQ